MIRLRSYPVFGVLVGVSMVVMPGCGADGQGTKSGNGRTQTLYEVTNGDASVYAGGAFALVVGGTEKLETTAFSVSASGGVTKVDVPPWLGDWVVGTSARPSGGMAVTVFECPGERSSEDSTCSEDYRSTVWTTSDGNEWTQLNSASVSGTALNGAMTVFPVSVSQDLDRAASVVDLYTHALLVEYDGDDVNVAELPSSVTAACAAPDGVVVQLRADAADLDGGDEMTSTTAAPGDVPRPSFRFESVEYVSMKGTVGRRIETDGGRLFCGDGEEFALISDAGTVTPVDSSTFHVA